MANEMPPASNYTGLSNSVLRYIEAFNGLIGQIRSDNADTYWAALEELVDTEAFERQGIFRTAQAERFGWATYRSYVNEFAGHTQWEGTLRRITETPGRVILELEERNTRGGITDRSNTVTIYDFNDAGKLIHLDVYVMPLEKFDAA